VVNILTEPEVHLVNWTPRILDTMMWAFSNMHNEIPTDKVPTYTKEETAEFLDVLKRVPHKTVMEFGSTVWYIYASRALQQQLTRTRMAAYSIQSLRIADARGDYFATPETADRMQGVCDFIDSGYREMKEEMKTEDARAILPLNVMSPITMCINLRALQHMLTQRLCNNAQREVRIMAQKMKQEIIDKIHPQLGELFQPPCEADKTCHSPVPCGKYTLEYDEVVYGKTFIKG